MPNMNLPYLDRPFDDCFAKFVSTRTCRVNTIPDPAGWIRTRPTATGSSSEPSSPMAPSADSSSSVFPPVPPSLSPSNPSYSPSLAGPIPGPVREEHEGGPYNSYEIITSIEEDTGVGSAAVASPSSYDSRSAFWRSSGGYARLTVTWMAERYGAMPVLPHWQLQDPMYVLRKKTITPSAPRFDPQVGVYVYTVRGQYVYDLKAPPRDTFNYPVGVTRVLANYPTEFQLMGYSQFSPEPLAFLCLQSPPEGTVIEV